VGDHSILLQVCGFTFAVSATELALGGVAVTEAGRAAELVVRVDEEVSSLAAVAPLTFDVLPAVF
jgi:hypothetical protein